MQPTLHHRREDHEHLPFLVWAFPRPRPTASTAAVGGGVGSRAWILNAMVPRDYARTDLEQHVGELATSVTLTGSGVGLLTAVDVSRRRFAELDGVTVCSTVGVTDRIRVDRRIALPDLVPRPDGSEPTDSPVPGGARSGPEPESTGRHRAGTINIVVTLPVRLDEAALLDALTIATEAKVAALLDTGIDATGTPTDSVTVCADPTGPAERFAGSGTAWGSRLGRLVHETVHAGVLLQRAEANVEPVGDRPPSSGTGRS